MPFLVWPPNWNSRSPLIVYHSLDSTTGTSFWDYDFGWKSAQIRGNQRSRNLRIDWQFFEFQKCSLEYALEKDVNQLFEMARKRPWDSDIHQFCVDMTASILLLFSVCFFFRENCFHAVHHWVIKWFSCHWLLPVESMELPRIFQATTIPIYIFLCRHKNWWMFKKRSSPNFEDNARASHLSLSPSASRKHSRFSGGSVRDVDCHSILTRWTSLLCLWWNDVCANNHWLQRKFKEM